MDAFGSLLHGFSVALQPINLFWAFVGSALGTAIGVLPGIGPALTIALLLPVTVYLEPTGAFIMFAGILYGAMYGGSTTSILLNTPGESGSMMTALEGNKMAKNGRGAAALATAAIGSYVAGTLATVALTFLAPAIAELAFIFGPQDYFALIENRFSNPKIGDTIPRLAQDGSNRQPKFILPSTADRLAKGLDVQGLALVSALWCRYFEGTSDGGKAIVFNDPSADRLHAAALASRTDPQAFIGMTDIFGAVGTDARFQKRYREAIDSLRSNGTAATLQRYIDGTLAS